MVLIGVAETPRVKGILEESLPHSTCNELDC